MAWSWMRWCGLVLTLAVGCASDDANVSFDGGGDNASNGSGNQTGGVNEGESNGNGNGNNNSDNNGQTPDGGAANGNGNGVEPDAGNTGPQPMGCDAQPCGVNATCQTVAGKRECVCDVGFQDNDSNGTCTANCATTTCNANATCADTTGSAICACNQGFQDNDNNGSCTANCATTTCNANATCADTTGSAICACNQGFQDNDNNGSCTANCATTNCGANATCADATGTAICTCDTNFQDNDGNGSCTTSCASVDCGDHGDCEDADGSAACACDSGFTGAACDTCATGFTGAACDTCANGFTGTGCADCVDGFFGPTCSACPACVNGSCNDGKVGNGLCACTGNFAGALCDTCREGYTGAACDTCAIGYEDFDADDECEPECDGIDCDGLDSAVGLATGVHELMLLSGSVPLYVDGDYEGGGWILIGRGREDWAFSNAGKGAYASIKDGIGTNAAFTPAYLPSALVQGLLTHTEDGVEVGDVEVRLKRATNVFGDTFQEVLWQFTARTTWDWVLDQNDASHAIRQTVRPGVLGAGSYYRTGNSYDIGPGNDHTRVFTWAWANHGNKKGFAYGSTITDGVNHPQSFLWENTNENHGLPYTEVYLRLPRDLPSGCEEVQSLDPDAESGSYEIDIDGAFGVASEVIPCVFNEYDSCADILAEDPSAESDFYEINLAGEVYCDMTTDGGGYTFHKADYGSVVPAEVAEAVCEARGMQLFIPRSQPHLQSAYAIATNANIGPTANWMYLYMLGIYPNTNGATCSNRAFQSTTAGCNWSASDDGPFWVGTMTNTVEPNGDNNIVSSMGYSFDGGNYIVRGYNDIPYPGYTARTFMCDVGDKLGAPLCYYNTCSDHGECESGTGAEVCVCDTGYTGAACAQCDTGYQDHNGDGTCSAACAAGTCTEVGKVCVDDSGTATCQEVDGASCLAIKTANSNAESGMYVIDPDGAGALGAIELYCDMTANGGGWTLIGKIAAGTYSSLTSQQYIDLVANPLSHVRRSLLADGAQPSAGQIAFWNRATTNALFNDAGGRVVRVIMSNNTQSANNNRTFFQQKVSPPASWDLWHAIRDSRLWNAAGAVSGTDVTGFGTDFVLAANAAQFNAVTNTVTHEGDGSFGWWSADTLPVSGGGTLTVTRHGGLLNDGYANQGWQWLFTLDRNDSRFKADTAQQRSTIWLR